MTPPGLALAFAGFTALCLAMDRHGEQVFGTRRTPAGRRRALQVLGSLLLAGSLALVVGRNGWGLGLVVWTGLLTAAAIPLAMLLCYRPRAVPAAAAAVLLGALAWLAAAWPGG